LPTVLALRLPLVGAFFPSHHHRHFMVPDTLKLMSTWSTFQHCKSLAPLWNDCAILASGSLNFLATVEALVGSHSALFAFSVDTFFPRSGLRDTRRLFRSVATHKVRDGYNSAITDHSHYGGATNGVHFVLLKDPDGRGLPTPGANLRRTLKHFVNPAAWGGYSAIDPPDPLPSDIAHAAIKVGGLGCMEGLFNVTAPLLEYVRIRSSAPFVVTSLSTNGSPSTTFRLL